MTFHLSSLFSSGGSSDPQACASFSIRPAPWDGTKILVHQTGYPIDSPPMYSITISSSGKSNVVVSRGWGGGPWDVVGDARLPTFSSKIHLTIHGQPTEMRFSEMSGNSSFPTPSMGKLKWKLDSMSTKKMDLLDESGRKLAKVHSGKASGEKILDILIPHDIFFLEVVLLSAWANKAQNKTALEASGEVIGAVLGA
ncbi:unnamed protein product [Penicillium salamii]|uniref:Uncharacterized protein n=1 Tax=Penicillium salamii TaxID=1612424 RepID=A0A9W4J8Q3_9EURO|nr:unnamed protein product [Penicillium salamii]CAG8368783.1 unnamed protein product [Penicillium salamii]CAG8384361.1 unnamed protein product [Penicillium salamii]